MEGIQIDPEKVPPFTRRKLARPLLSIVAKAFEDPNVQRDFERWKQEKKAKEESEKVHSSEA